ncbi:MAG: hypothetical protein IJY09_04905 [Lachnospiraceae bacterium]|nr:hypothetical protein [Lachnospiraceae bacterium]
MKRKSGFGADKMVGLIFALVGIIFLAVGVLINTTTKRFAENADKTKALISDISTYRDSDGDRWHDVTVTYVKDGKEYEVELSDYNSSMREGDMIEILLDGNRAMSADGAGKGAGIAIVVGGLTAGIGIALMVASGMRKRKKRKIIETGRAVYAEVTGGMLCTNITVNGRHPYKLDCKYEDVYSGSIYMFRSDYMWEDPDLYVGRQIKVYVNPDAMNEYFVDIDSMMQATEISGEGVYDFR